ncbi:conserved hypothetical protein [Metallosphaera cuprina Ar-4]|uniref:16S rRNA aminocarboxypropyltransferase n=1 Tax=Metallosphaera cuprina (strain Ar-4) TaxID=1006006 RepID=F4G261_METCR|nr:conserved hypothetical protein [Metallosphaera cuprina Ar-4]
MVRLGLAKRTNRPIGIVLNPLSNRVISIDDKDTIMKRGLTILDSSWNRSDENFFQRYERNGRRLPFLLAGNPVNYSKPFRLSSLEAVIASLYIISEIDNAMRFASIMKWGKTFLELNKWLLEEYKGKSSQEILSIEEQFLKEIREPRQ